MTRRNELHWGWWWLVCTVCLSTLCALVSCGARPVPNAAPSLEPITPPAVVLVDNKGFYDANVYVLVSGAVVRKLGTVDGFSRRQFALVGPQFAPSQSIALYAKTIAEGQEYASGSFTLYAGIGMRWTLEAHGNEWLVPMSEAH